MMQLSQNNNSPRLNYGNNATNGEGTGYGNSGSVINAYPRSKSILDHLQECKRENNERLKNVKNLEDLVMFKLTTVVDKIKEEQGEGADVQDAASLDIFQKLCDPLLVGRGGHFHQLPKRAYYTKGSKALLQKAPSAIRQQSESMLDASMEGPKIERSPMFNLKEGTQLDQKGFQLPGLSLLKDPSSESFIKRPSQGKSEEPRRRSSVATTGIPASGLGSDDPIKFLQHYFKQDPSAKQQRKIVNSNYFADKLEKKYGIGPAGGGSMQPKNFNSGSYMLSATSGIAISEHELASPSIIRGSLLNQQSDFRSNSQVIIEGQPKVSTQGGASFYSFSKVNESQPNPENMHGGSNAKVFEEEVSMNVINFNKMREELQDLLGNNQDVGIGKESQSQIGVESPYVRNVQFRSVVRSGEEISNVEDPNPYLLPPIVEHKSPRNKGLVKDEFMTSSHSQGRVTFGRRSQPGRTSPKAAAGYHHPSKYVRNGGSSDEDEDDEANLSKNYRDYFNEYATLARNKDKQMPGVSRDEKIRQILMNENPNLISAHQISYLSKIQEVKSLGFDRFRHLIMKRIVAGAHPLVDSPSAKAPMKMNQKPSGRKTQLINTKIPPHLSQPASQSQISVAQNQGGENESQILLNQSMNYLQGNWETQGNDHLSSSMQRSQTNIKRHQQNQERARETDLMRFNMNKNFEQFQEKEKLNRREAPQFINPQVTNVDVSPLLDEAHEQLQKQLLQDQELYLQLRQRNLGIREYMSQKVTNREELQFSQADVDLRQEGNTPVNLLQLLERNEINEQYSYTDNTPVLAHHMLPQNLELIITRDDYSTEQYNSNAITSPSPQHPIISTGVGKVSFIKKRNTNNIASHQAQKDRDEIHLIGAKPREDEVGPHLGGQDLSNHSNHLKTLHREVAAGSSLQALSMYDGSEQMSVIGNNNATNQGPIIAAAAPSAAYLKKNTTSRYFKMMKQQQKAHNKADNMEAMTSTAAALESGGGNHITATNSYLMLEQFSEEIQNQLIDLAMSKRKAWSPRRFKKFPRFTIFLNRNGEEDQETSNHNHLKDQIISLNPEFMNLLLNANATEGSESVIQQIEHALASINYPANMKNEVGGGSDDEEGGYRFQDPFDKVLLTKGIDNQILTSFRTLTKANNVVSDTLKIIHNKFSPTPAVAVHQLKKKAQQLYVINEEVFNNTANSEEEVDEDDLMEEFINYVPPSERRGSSNVLLDSSGPSSTKNLLMDHEENGEVKKKPLLSKSIVYQQSQQQSFKLQQDQRVSLSHLDETVLDTTIDINDQKSTMLHVQQSGEGTLILNKSHDDTTTGPSPSRSQVPDHSKGNPFSPPIHFSNINKQGEVQKSTIILQKIDPADMFGMQKSSGGLQPSFQKLTQPQGYKKIDDSDSHHAYATKWNTNLLPAGVATLSSGLNGQNHSNVSYSEYQTTKQPTPGATQQINSAQHKVRMEVIESQLLPRAIQGSNVVPLAPKKKLIGFAGGFQAYNMTSQQQSKPCVQNTNLSLDRYSYGAMQNMKQGINQDLTQLDQGPSKQAATQNFLENLSDQERFELAKKLILPPVSKLKHMIDDLYQKEKKYVKHYLREDFIEKNNFIFDLQKSHALQTTMNGISQKTRLQELEESTAKSGFVGGLYSINAIQAIQYPQPQPGGGGFLQGRQIQAE